MSHNTSKCITNYPCASCARGSIDNCEYDCCHKKPCYYYPKKRTESERIEDELMSKIFKINKEIDALCYERDQLINDFYELSNKKKKGTESERSEEECQQ